MKEQIKNIARDYFQGKPVFKAYLFGSALYDSKTAKDIDILVELDYKNGADYFLFYDMQQDLSRLLKSKVDLVSANGLSPHIKPVIDSEKELIYER
jgi:predicted nucleotidyltransferase